MTDYVCVDASLAVKWVLPEEDDDKALALYEQSAEAAMTVTAPPHFPAEVTNALRRRVARGLVTLDKGRDLLRAFERFRVRLLVPPNLYQDAFEMADTFHRSTVYDTLYVALAGTLGCDFWTADERLLNALAGRFPFVKPIRDYPG